MPLAAPTPSWSEERLVRECLKGREDAWSALVDRYKNLVYSIPLKYGLNVDDANDIFQSVFFELLAHLPELRQPKALPMWLIQTASHKCLSVVRGNRRFEQLDELEQEGQAVEDPVIGEEALRE